MIRRKPDTVQSSYLSTPPPETSPRSSIVVSDWDADDEATSMEDVRSTRPSSVVLAEDDIQQETPSYPQRPTLPDVLSNSAPPPWTLSAFTAYLSQMHCLENLEFTMDAERYRERYNVMSSQLAGTPPTPTVEECKYVRMLWQRLIDAYIMPDGPREINLPSDVRDTLLTLPNNHIPPRPETLNPAVKIIYNLMEESVLISFLNEVPSLSKGRQSNHNRQKPSQTKARRRGDSDSSTERRSERSKSSRRHSPTTSLETAQSRSEYSSKGDPTGRLTPNARVRHAPSYTSGNGDTGSLTDDSINTPCPGAEPMTPPNTPPSSDFGGHSPRSRNDNGWKKMLGWKKKSSTGMRDSRYPTLDD